MERDDTKLFVSDADVLSHEPLTVYYFEQRDAAVPVTLPEQPASIKDTKRDVSRGARVALRIIKDTPGGDITPHRLVKGVNLPAGRGISPKNLYQSAATPALPDCGIFPVIPAGPAGSGNTGIVAAFFSVFAVISARLMFFINNLSVTYTFKPRSSGIV